MTDSEVSWLSGLGLLHGYGEPPWSPSGNLLPATDGSHAMCDTEARRSMSCKNGEVDGHCGGRPVISLPEKGFNAKMESKYTLRIKASGNFVADDGYKWRKYGQKTIKNSPNPRSYYRCTNPRCNAKRQVERSIEDPETLIITYEGLHLHYTYSHLLLSQSHHHHPVFASSLYHARKKPKTLAADPDEQEEEEEEEEDGDDDENEMQPMEESVAVGDHPQDNTPSKKDELSQQDLIFYDESSNQGLLEDIVPLMVRNPSSTSSNQARSSLPPSSPSCSLSPAISQFGAVFFPDSLYQRGCQKT